MLKEFKEFALKGNIMDMAVGVVIGGAFQKIVNSLVNDIIMPAISILIGIMYTIAFVKPVYTSSTTLLLATSGSTSNQANTITTTDLTLNSKLVSTYSALAQSKSVLSKVISNLGIKMSEDELKNNVSVTQKTNTEIIVLSVTNSDPTLAEKLTNETAKVFMEKVTEIYKINNVQVVDQAEVSTTPSNVNHTKDVIMFAAIGIVVSIIYVIGANMLDTTVKTAEDVEKQFKVPVLASIPMYNFNMEKGGKKR